MAWSAFSKSCKIPYVSDDKFVAKANQHLAAKSTPTKVELAFPGLKFLLIHPAQLLHHLGWATAAAIPYGRHPAAHLWALARYVDAFAEVNGELQLATWVSLTERNHRRAVLSEDLGVAMCAAVASRVDPRRTLMDVDAFSGTHQGTMWLHRKSRPDYVTGEPNVSQPGTDRSFNVWEAKGRSGSATTAVASTFADGALQTCALTNASGWQVDNRYVVGAMVGDPTLGHHALKVAKAQGGSIDPALPSEPEAKDPTPPKLEAALNTLFQFAGIRPDSNGSSADLHFESGGRSFVGRSVTVPTEEGLITAAIGLDSEILNHTPEDRAKEWYRSMTNRLLNQPRTLAVDEPKDALYIDISEEQITTIHPNGTSLQISLGS